MSEVKEVQVQGEMKAYYWSRDLYIYCSRLYNIKDLKELAERLGKKLILTEKKPGDT